jgi:uncharacterized protein YecT (DUF1311 family)
MPRKAIVATFILLLMTATASAQMPPVGAHINEDTGKSPRTKEQREYDKALDRTYQSTIKKIPDAERKSDPWGNIRPTQPAAAVKNKQQ